MLEINVWSHGFKVFKRISKIQTVKGRFFDFVKPWLRVKTGLLIFLEWQIEC